MTEPKVYDEATEYNPIPMREAKFRLPVLGTLPHDNRMRCHLKPDPDCVFIGYEEAGVFRHIHKGDVEYIEVKDA